MAGERDHLGRYRAKRDFRRSPEPRGTRRRSGGEPRFVIQKHAASSLHYGAGEVIVWDAGTYRSLTEGSVEAALDGGHLSVWLEGHKLRGGWTLQRTRGGTKPQWLLVKRRDEGADARRNPVSTQPEPVRSGRTIEDLAGDGDG